MEEKYRDSRGDFHGLNQGQVAGPEQLIDYEFTMPMGPQYVSGRGWERYREALQLLIPFRKKMKNKIIEVDNSGFFSFITFSWISHYIYKAYKKGLTVEDIPLCSSYDSGDLNSQRLEHLWTNELNKMGAQNASFARAVWKFLQTRILVSCIVFIFITILGFISSAIFMKKLIEYAQDPDAQTTVGLFWAFTYTFCELLKLLLFALYYSINYRTATRLKAACLTLVYKKIICLNSIGSISSGEVINLYASDGVRLFYMVVFGPMILGGPLVLILCASYIYLVLGPWSLLGLCVFLLYYPLQYLLSRLTGYFKEKTIQWSDERLRLMTEVLHTIKLIKLYAWETCFMDRIQSIRKQELHTLHMETYCQSIGISMAPTIPVISGILTLIIHVLSGGTLTAAQAYPLITLLHSQLRTSLLNLRYGSENIIDGLLSFKRIKGILLLEEMKHIVGSPEDSIAILVKKGVFKWKGYSEKPGDQKKVKGNKKEDSQTKKLLDQRSTKPFTLNSIDLCVKKGSLIGICGTVGSGKSSLLKACMGQMTKVSGEILMSGKVAYVSQQAWIENATLKENILFWEAFEPERYKHTLYCCCLNKDVNCLPAGDDTEIGEKGLNLSGGQKLRLSLARALYSNRDIYFLDDPFSAVDPPVASHIFENCILDALKEKTVILVTHHVRFLEKCDEILFMKDGKIIERGNHRELMSKSGEYFSIVESHNLSSFKNTIENDEVKGDHKNAIEEKESVESNGHNAKSSTGKKFMVSENMAQGEIKPFVYQAYINAAGGIFFCALVCLVVFLNVGASTFSSWWLAMWLKAGSGNVSYSTPITNDTAINKYMHDNANVNFHMQVYAGMIGIICATGLLRSTVFTKISLKVSRKLHDILLEKLMKSRLMYFEVTPIGQIQNIYSRDLNEVDARLSGAMESMLQNMSLVGCSVLLILVVFPWFTVALFVLSIFYYSISKIFRVAIRDLRRMESISKTPLFSLLSATLNGLPVIQAFNKQSEYLKEFFKKFDENTVRSYMSSCVMRWMAIRLDSISVTIVFITSMLVVILKSEVVPALAGLALTYSAHISGILQYTVRLMSEVEGKFISIERILLNIKVIETEKNEKEIVVTSDWPSQGCVQFENVILSYSKNLPPVLNDIKFTIRAGEKIGIVGRTGVGKSSLVTALFRLVELNQGKIFIDGVNISDVSLWILRSRMSVIPQDAIIFSGTLRFNLDPFGKYSDDVIWKALEQAKLSNKIRSMAKGLLTLIGEEDKFSVGECQLLCLARILLQKSKILVLDEATASVDPDTESALQTILNDSFKHCTVITIAHRLKTIKSCDKVLVLHQGMVQEFDNPHTLLENPDSFFSSMVKTLK